MKVRSTGDPPEGREMDSRTAYQWAGSLWSPVQNGMQNFKGTSRQKFMASISTRALTKPQGTGGQVRRVPYRRQKGQPGTHTGAKDIGAWVALVLSQIQIVEHCVAVTMDLGEEPPPLPIQEH